MFLLPCVRNLVCTCSLINSDSILTNALDLFIRYTDLYLIMIFSLTGLRHFYRISRLIGL